LHKPKRPFQQLKTEEHRINGRIYALEVRLVIDNAESQIVSLKEALKRAEDLELDLIEVVPNAKPPVCRIADYSKFLYDKKKREKEQKAKQIKVVIKEIRFTSNTDDHDFDFKAKHAEEFIKEGSKVKAYVQFRGRAIMFKERGELLLLKLGEHLQEIATIEQLPKLEGKRMFMMINPKQSKKNLSH